MSKSKFETRIEVYCNDAKFAVIEKYYPDERHPNRKWCYRKGLNCFYSDTAKTIEEMVIEFMQNEEIDWAYCGAHDITLKFVPIFEEVKK